ncbi:MAG: hypothetical protein K0R67_2817 [Paenibacillus sp.]|nr:hypothetical protein [Paenibacillus sp.]
MTQNRKDTQPAWMTRYPVIKRDAVIPLLFLNLWLFIVATLIHTFTGAALAGYITNIVFGGAAGLIVSLLLCDIIFLVTFVSLRKHHRPEYTRKAIGVLREYSIYGLLHTIFCCMGCLGFVLMLFSQPSLRVIWIAIWIVMIGTACGLLTRVIIHLYVIIKSIRVVRRGDPLQFKFICSPFL